VVELWSDRLERLDPGSVLSSTRGDLTVERSRHLQASRYVVAFAGVADRTGAEELRGLELRAAALDPAESPGTLWVHQLVGATVRDRSGADLGTVTEVEPNPASDLLVLDSGVLIPMHFVTDFDARAGRVEVDPPPGLLDL
jgi:16S rRNA processing protein RimM